ncbi:RNA 2',3'-cyclic phosphodiesterase [uncultured Desulfovibrio sp.]|uniref:RNA 2',3'-cyclic phosphodiesterase n=1 Tax=uncultured Desulfovibrio sp. TaxID=167968 RepID=UPI00260CE3E5|nr:RNA 2',3'-cyclic phosphodiesterase [uncultured Desulfovibrio sp.]
MKTSEANGGSSNPANPNVSRLFVAITLPDALKARLSGLHADFPDLKWTTLETMHLTLRFIGQTTSEQVEAVRRTLRSVKGDEFTLIAVGLGIFQRRDTGVLWVGIKEEPALFALKRMVDDALRDDAGLNLKDEPYSPHLTLSRLKKTPSRELKDAVKARIAERFGEIPVASFTLFRSLLRPTGAIHEAVETYPLEERRQ